MIGTYSHTLFTSFFIYPLNQHSASPDVGGGEGSSGPGRRSPERRREGPEVHRRMQQRTGEELVQRIKYNPSVKYKVAPILVFLQPIKFDP